MTMEPTWLLVGLLAFTACSHESKRDNPLDPELTPPVELQVALDDTAGTVTLTWTPYEGEAPFAAYWIIRIAQAPEVIDTLAVLSDVAAASFIDSTLVTESFYSYRVSVINDAGLEVPSQIQSIRPLDLPAVEIQDLQLDSRAATATLTWTAYAGSRFHAYRILRRTDDSPPQIIAEIDDISTISAVDGALDGNTAYHYEVVVLTTLGEEIESEERTGVFHDHLDTWPLDMEDGGYTRLYNEDDRILVLISEEQRVRLLSFDPSGQLLEDQKLLGHPSLSISPQTTTLTLLPEGRRLLGVVTNTGVRGLFPQLLAYDADGSPLLREIELEQDFESFGPSATEVEGQVFLHCIVGQPAFDNVRLTSNDRLLIDDTFDTPGLGEWELLEGQAEVEDGRLLLNSSSVVRRKVKAFWHDMRLEADVTEVGIGQTNRPAIIAKADTLPSLGFNPLAGTVEEHTSLLVSLAYTRASRVAAVRALPPLDFGLQLQGFSDHFTAAIGMTYRMRIETDAGLPRGAIESPSWWPSDPRQYLLGVPGPASLISLEDGWAFAVGDSLTRIAPGLPDITGALDHPISEMRIWETASGPQIGICVPDRHKIQIAPVGVSRAGYIDWPFTAVGTPIEVGLHAGQEPGAFFYPLSFDVGVDGRIFVLDAGNRRIQAFDTEGIYITQWGSSGTADGQFDFGSGDRPEEFTGSIAVDDEGFIYVADVGNKRIQKFAP